MDSATETPAVDEELLADCVRSVLARHDLPKWRVERGEVWCVVQAPDRPARVQGWKLHVSATPLSAPLVLARSADVLARHRCQFKFAATVDRVRDIVSRHVDRGSGGKFITAYPEGGDD